MDTVNSQEVDIENYNKAVIKAFSANKPIKAKSCRSVKGLKLQAKFPCKRCDFSTKSVANLKKHKLAKHTGNNDSQSSDCIIVKHSTRNNSFADDEKLLVEDISLTAIMNITEVAVTARAEEMVENQEENAIKIVKCTMCAKTFECNDVLNNHIQSEHASEPNNEELEIKSDKAEEIEVLENIVFSYLLEVFADEVNMKHVVHEDNMEPQAEPTMTLTCKLCEFKTDNDRSLKTHIKKKKQLIIKFQPNLNVTFVSTNAC